MHNYRLHNVNIRERKHIQTHAYKYNTYKTYVLPKKEVSILISSSISRKEKKNE